MIENIVGYLAAALAAVVIYLVLPALRARIGAERYALLCRWVAAAVQAAEQVFAGSGMGRQKKAYALQVVQAQLPGTTEAQAEALIEAEVFRMKGGSHD